MIGFGATTLHFNSNTLHYVSLICILHVICITFILHFKTNIHLSLKHTNFNSIHFAFNSFQKFSSILAPTIHPLTAYNSLLSHTCSSQLNFTSLVLQRISTTVSWWSFELRSYSAIPSQVHSSTSKQTELFVLRARDELKLNQINVGGSSKFLVFKSLLFVCHITMAHESLPAD